MKSTPMLMAGPLVVPTLADLKTHSCRPLLVPWAKHSKVPPYEPYFLDCDGVLQFCDEYGVWHEYVKYARCPFGTVGDRIWIKEKWKIEAWTGDDADPMLIRYAADNATEWREVTSNDGSKTPELEAEKFLRPRWTPSMNMPRWASRITLEVTSVSVFRVQDITEEIAKREGVAPDDEPCDHPRQSCADVGCIGREWKGYRAGFAQVWIDLYGRESWATNPWVWGIGFKRVKP